MAFNRAGERCLKIELPGYSKTKMFHGEVMTEGGKENLCRTNTKEEQEAVTVTSLLTKMEVTLCIVKEGGISEVRV